jgi:Arc/MetJ family transcription regulator
MADIQIDDLLVEVAQRLSGHRNANDMVAQAVTEYVQRLQHQELLSFLTEPPFDFDVEPSLRPNGE